MRSVRRAILIVVSSLISLGIVMIYSSSAIYAFEVFGDSLYFLKRHLLYLLVGILSAVGVMSVDLKMIRKAAKPLVGVSIILLLFVLLIGQEVGGARRWIRFWGMSFQPSEFAGLCLLIYCADFLDRKAAIIRDLRFGVLPLLLVLGAVVFPIVIQPDLGTAVLLCIITLTIAFAGAVRLKHILSLFLAVLPFLYFFVINVPYRRRRIEAFLNPWADPRGSGFQIIQSYLALGSGGLFGVGLGHSYQKLFYLPQSYTDFIFSIIGEELGLLGTGGVLILFALFIGLGMKIARSARTGFSRLLSLGIVLLIGLKAIINIAVAIGLVPTKGLPLPFISYGGSSLVFNMIAVGLLLNVSREESGDGIFL